MASSEQALPRIQAVPAVEALDSGSDLAWADMDMWDRIAKWEARAPGAAGELLQVLKAERRHAHRLEWAYWAKQVTGVLLGFGSVVVMALLAWHYADLGSPINGAVVMGAGTASIVAIFVTGKYVKRDQRQ